MPDCSAICFDLFNTLVSVGEVPDNVGRFTADVLGVDHEVWNAACFGPAHEICRPTQHADILRALAHSIDPSIPAARIDEAVQERQARFDHALCNVRPGILSTLRALKQRGMRLALISNASSGEIAAWPESPLAALFDLALFSCECGLKKPDRDIYHSALSHLGTRVEETVYVGDGGSQEFMGAAGVGMQTVLTREFLKPHRYRKVVAEQGEMIGREVQALVELLEIFA